MYKHQTSYRKLPGFLIMILLPVLFAGCGFSIGSGSSTSNTTVVVACPTPLPIQTVQGTIQSINGTTLVIAGTNGKTSNATYTSTTRFALQSKTVLSALQRGAFVIVTAKQAASNTYTATTISISNNPTTGTGGFGGFGGQGSGSSSPCATPVRRTGTGNRLPARGNGTTRIIGTVSQIAGNTLTVTRTAARFSATPTATTPTNVTVDVSSATQVLQTSQTTASALKVGVRVNLVGVSNGQGGITAHSITILAP